MLGLGVGRRVLVGRDIVFVTVSSRRGFFARQGTVKVASARVWLRTRVQLSTCQL
jgi:hypothetical protein